MSMNEIWINVTRYTRKTLIWLILLIITIFLVDFAIKSLSKIEIEAIRDVSLMLLSYENYILALIFLVLGYKVVSSFSHFIYWSIRKVSDHSTAASLRSITRIVGIAVLISVLTSIFNLNPSAAITLGSFTGLVVGFATQTVLNHAVAGIFLIFSRPFKVGDHVIIGGNKGVVEDITIMHTIIRSEDGSQLIMIPSGSIVSSTIVKFNKKRS